MRNAVGATWIFGLCLVFIILFTSYLTISMNYAKAFRIKNYIVSVLEENEGYTNSVDERVSDYLYNQGYNSYGTCENYIEANGYEWDIAGEIDISDNLPTKKHNACIYRLLSPDTGDEGVGATRSRYRVVTFFRFDLPLVRYFTQFQVAGESRYIYDFAANSR